MNQIKEALVGCQSGLLRVEFNQSELLKCETLCDYTVYGLCYRQDYKKIMVLARTDEYVNRRARSRLEIWDATTLRRESIQELPRVIDGHQMITYNKTKLIITSTGTNELIVHDWGLNYELCAWYTNEEADDGWDTDHLNSLYYDASNQLLYVLAHGWGPPTESSILVLDRPNDETDTVYPESFLKPKMTYSGVGMQAHNVYIDHKGIIWILDSYNRKIVPSQGASVSYDYFLRGLSVFEDGTKLFGGTAFISDRDLRKSADGKLIYEAAAEPFTLPKTGNVNEILILNEPDLAHTHLP